LLKRRGKVCDTIENLADNNFRVKQSCGLLSSQKKKK